MKKPLVILVAGGSASGKSTVVKEILDTAGLKDVNIIRHDDYYMERSDLPFEEREKINYDHPDSLDNELLFNQISNLIDGKIINKPVYDFVVHNRSKNIEVVNPKPILIIEGILILSDERIRKLSDINIFVELDDDTRFIRRLLRDMKDRGRSLDSVIKQYQTTVKPMYHKYIKPTKRYADVIIPNDEKHDIAVDLIVAKIKQILGE